MGNFPVVYNLLQNGRFSAGKNQKEVYEAVAEKIKENCDFVVFPIGVPDAVHTNDVLKHNKLSLKEVACTLHVSCHSRESFPQTDRYRLRVQSSSPRIL
jgi:hypothetical protein